MGIEHRTGSPLARTLAIGGALALWGLAAGLLWSKYGSIDVLAKEPAPQSLPAPRADVEVPQPTRVLFRFARGSADLAQFQYGTTRMEQDNFKTLEGTLDLMGRLRRLPVTGVWVGAADPLTAQRVRSVERALASRAPSRDATFAAGSWPLRSAALPPDAAGHDLLELRLTPESRPSRCNTLIEVLDPELPADADRPDRPVSLFAAGGRFEVGRNSVVRTVAAPGRGAEAGPWRPFVPGDQRVAAAQSKAMGDVQPWDVVLLVPAECEVELVARR